jgi:hypothetical protein
MFNWDKRAVRPSETHPLGKEVINNLRRSRSRFHLTLHQSVSVILTYPENTVSLPPYMKMKTIKAHR